MKIRFTATLGDISHELDEVAVEGQATEAAVFFKMPVDDFKEDFPYFSFFEDLVVLFESKDEASSLWERLEQAFPMEDYYDEPGNIYSLNSASREHDMRSYIVEHFSIS